MWWMNKETYYEMATMNELHNKISSGDISVIGSRQHKNFEEYLVSKGVWQQAKQVGTRLAVPLCPKEYLQERTETLRERLDFFSNNFHRLEDATFEDGSLHVQRLEKVTPPEAEKLSETLYSMLPRIKLTDLLTEVAGWTGFEEEFIHASSGHAPRGNEKTVLMAAIMAMGTNIGLTKMADATPEATYRQMASAVQWRMYDDAMNRTLAVLVRFQHKEPFSQHWGKGNTSSSDGLQVQVGVSSLHADANPHHGHGKEATLYNFVNDQYSSYYTDVIPTNSNEALTIMDGVFHHETDLQIEEHYTDTAGFTDQIFGLSHILGLRFAPRLRDLDNLNLFTIEPASSFPKLKLYLHRIKTKDITNSYDDVLWLSHSIREGVVPSALIMGKLDSYSRKNEIAKALQEMGKIERTIFLIHYVSDPAFRRRIHRGLNKGESVNALARAIFFGKRGVLRERTLIAQLQRASALSILINAITIWNTIYLSKAAECLMQTNPFPEHLLSHISPLEWSHINLLGEYKFNFDRTIGLHNLRPLRMN
jgi:TnpA family transposase